MTTKTTDQEIFFERIEWSWRKEGKEFQNEIKVNGEVILEDLYFVLANIREELHLIANQTAKLFIQNFKINEIN